MKRIAIAFFAFVLAGASVGAARAATPRPRPGRASFAPGRRPRPRDRKPGSRARCALIPCSRPTRPPMCPEPMSPLSRARARPGTNTPPADPGGDFRRGADRHGRRQGCGNPGRRRGTLFPECAPLGTAPRPMVAMTHMALTGVKDGKNAVWHEKVSDAEYNRPVSK